MTTDPLAIFWQHDVTVERLAGEGAAGRVYAASTPERGNVAQRNQMVRDAAGDEVTASASVAFPASVAAIPPGSRVTLPDGRVSRVVATAASDLPDPFPATLVAYLE